MVYETKVSKLEMPDLHSERKLKSIERLVVAERLERDGEIEKAIDLYSTSSSLVARYKAAILAYNTGNYERASKIYTRLANEVKDAAADCGPYVDHTGRRRKQDIVLKRSQLNYEALAIQQYLPELKEALDKIVQDSESNYKSGTKTKPGSNGKK